MDRELSRLEADLKQLEAEYNMYFAGRLPKPPWETRARVEATVKQFDRGHMSNTGDRFRFNTLQSRYAAFIDLWDRALRAREEGRPGPLAQKRTSIEPQKKGPDDRILHVSSFRDPLREIDKLTDLYESLAPHSINHGEIVPADLLALRAQSAVHNPDGTFVVYRIGDAVASRNIHAAILDAYRLCNAI